jgi:hypothetical protein
MTHWGWYWKHKKKHKSKTTCSALKSIDSFELLKIKTFGGFTIDPLNIKVLLHENGLRVTYGKSAQHAYNIPVERQTCNFGGYRYYFRCPMCNMRMRKLYFTQRSLFLCRKCLNLSYDSQLLRPMRRYYHMTKKITSIVTQKGGDISINKKPPRMWNKTFQVLQNKHSYYEQMDRNAGNKELRAWYGPTIESELESFFDYVPQKNWPHKGKIHPINQPSQVESSAHNQNQHTSSRDI